MKPEVHGIIIREGDQFLNYRSVEGYRKAEGHLKVWATGGGDEYRRFACTGEEFTAAMNEAASNEQKMLAGHLLAAGRVLNVIKPI